MFYNVCGKCDTFKKVIDNLREDGLYTIGDEKAARHIYGNCVKCTTDVLDKYPIACNVVAAIKNNIDAGKPKIALSILDKVSSYKNNALREDFKDSLKTSIRKNGKEVR